MFGILATISIVCSSILMYKVRTSVKDGEQDVSPLTGLLLLEVAVCTFFVPFIAQALFYYGWKKKLPNKAKRANDIAWSTLLLLFAAAYFLGK